MGRMIDIAGQKFNRLTAIRPIESKHGEIVWECKCDCGNVVHVTSYDLRRGHTKSCGCLKAEIVRTVNIKHGLTHTAIRRTYTNMKTRCYNPNYYLFHRYGGRGITVCDEWLGSDGLVNFYNWAIDNGYDVSKSIDRKNNDKGYSPDNCRWTTPETQSNNRSSNRLITFEGVTQSLSEWARVLNIKPMTLRYKLEKGLSIKEIESGAV